MLINDIKESLDLSRKNKDFNKASFLSMLYSEVASFGKNNGNRVTTDAEAIKILKKIHSANKEVIEQALKANRSDIVDKIRLEFEIINQFLPKNLSDEDLENIITIAVNDLKDINNKSIGVIMNLLKEKYAGMYDGKKASTIIREKINLKG